MKSKEIKIQVKEYDRLNDLPEENSALLQQARLASKDAYAPYSGFFVGAAVELEDGTIVTGNNQENAAYPSGLCAERVALFYANAKYPDKAVKTIAITAAGKTGDFHDTVSPCGSCRQVMLETESKFNQPIRIILDGETIQVLDGVESLLPFGFRPQSLGE